MNGTSWKSGSSLPRRERIIWPSLKQAGSQAGLILLVILIWGGLLAAYLGWTEEPSGGQIAARGQDQNVQVEAASTGQPPTSLPVATATPLATATPVSPATGPSSRPSPEPSPTSAGTTVLAEPTQPPPELSPTPTETAAPPEVAEAAPEPAGETAVSFSADVLPILERRCVKCHGGEKTEEGLVMTSHADLLAGSWNGPVVEPGSAAESYLVELIVKGEMPKRDPRLLPGEIRAISAWIDAGALDN